MKFRGDNRRKRVLTDDKIEERGKMKILQITYSVSMSDTVIYDIKAKKTSGTSWYRGNPYFKYGVRSNSPPLTSNHKSRGKSQRSLGLATPLFL